MIYSMTAFAQAKIDTEIGELNCEVKSVNHRFLEANFRLPEEIRAFETDLRAEIDAMLNRGRLDLFFRFNEGGPSVLEPNEDVLKELSGLLDFVKDLVPSAAPIRAIDVLRWPAALKSPEINQETLKARVHEVLKTALDDLVSARQREGQRLAGLIEQRLAGIQTIVDEVTAFLPELTAAQQQRLVDKLADFKEQLEPGRIEQEMAILLNKSDVAEELDRLTVHVNEVRDVLTKDQPAGRRLDFLMQELNREANTLGSKSTDARLTKASVELKVLIEQMREQVQNIE